MISDELPQNLGGRMRRIRTVIGIIRILLGLMVLGIVLAIAFSFDAPKRVGLWPFAKYSSVHVMPVSILILGFIRAGVFFVGAFVLNKLLGIFSNGGFFSAGSIACAKWLGCLVLADWVVIKFLDAAAWRVVTLRFDDLTRLGLGLLVIVIAWVMDEGRKIQEEHQLTI
jgi:DUF2975 family protein